MCAFQCDSCVHKQVCTDEPNTRALNEECALYANVKNFTDVHWPKAEIAALISELESDKEAGAYLSYNWLLNKLRQLSAVLNKQIDAICPVTAMQCVRARVVVVCKTPDAPCQHRGKELNRALRGVGKVHI